MDVYDIVSVLFEWGDGQCGNPRNSLANWRQGCGAELCSSIIVKSNSTLLDF